MNLFREFLDSVFGINRYQSPNRNDDSRSYPGWYPPPPEEDQDERNPNDDCKWYNYRSDHFPQFPEQADDFDEIMKHMEKTFDEVFKIFGADNIPFFDPHVPPHGDNGNEWKKSKGRVTLGPEDNVRNEMLRRADGRDALEFDESERNVRNAMLRRDPSEFQTFANPYKHPSNNQRWSGATSPFSSPRSPQDKPQSDINLDSWLNNGKDIHDILDREQATPNIQQTPVQPDNDGGVKSFFRYSSIVTTRRSDGTIETRRVVRDEKGNEKETVEITKDPSDGKEYSRDLDMKSRFLKDHNFPNEDWAKRFFRW